LHHFVVVYAEHALSLRFRLLGSASTSPDLRFCLLMPSHLNYELRPVWLKMTQISCERPMLNGCKEKVNE